MKNLKEVYNDKVKLAALIVKGVTAALGGSLVLTTEHPYLALFVLSVGAAANEYLLYIERSNKK